MERSTLGLDPALLSYVADNNPPEHPSLKRLRAATARVPGAQMQITVEQGYLLQFLARLIGAKRAIEVGTFTGYSALAIALVLRNEGHLVACEINREYPAIGRPYWQEAGVDQKIDLRIAPAMNTLENLIADEGGGAYDFAFIDAEKAGYDGYFERCMHLVRTGGIIVLDNMLRRGRVLKPAADSDAALVAELNRKIACDTRVHSVLLAVGDGMTLVQKR